jgi:LacI family transcriptional regulator
LRNEVTLEDVAKAAGVHKATVSRALNPETQSVVNEQTVRRIVRVAERLGYVRNLTARSLRVQSTMTVGVVIPDLTNPIFPPMVRGIENYLAKHRYTVLLADTDESEEEEKEAIRSLAERRVDGFIVATGSDNHEMIPRMYDQGIAVVLANRAAGTVPFPLVTGDDEDGMRQAVEHLHRLGHRHIVHLAGPDNFSTTRIRAREIVRACGDLGITCDVVPVDNLRVDAGKSAVDKLLKQPPRFTAIQASTDLLALGALRSIRAHGLRCPEDISVIGFNDMPFTAEFSPGLTSVKVPLNEIGAEAARLLVTRLQEGKNSPRVVTLPVQLIARQSTGRAASR